MDRFYEREDMLDEEKAEREDRARQWKVDDAEAMETRDELVRKNGILLAKSRQC